MRQDKTTGRFHDARCERAATLQLLRGVRLHRTHKARWVVSAILATGVTILQYRAFETAQDRKAIAAFLQLRLEERYLRPCLSNPARHGFSMMAIGCLLIECLESFYRGWPHTRNRSELAFCGFFSRWERFADLRPIANPFYVHVRCGLLHQAETTGGWRIRRDGPMIDVEAQTINATVFLRRLRHTVKDYRSSLVAEPWSSALWQNTRRKLDSICRSSEPSSH